MSPLTEDHRRHSGEAIHLEDINREQERRAFCPFALARLENFGADPVAPDAAEVDCRQSCYGSPSSTQCR
jgi:hypothetical protein